MTTASQTVAACEPLAAPGTRRTRLAIIATQGTLDWAEFAKDAKVTLFV